MSELKPCPFCGNKDVELSLFNIGWPKAWRVHCERCKSDGAWSPDEQDAAQNWNTRAERVCKWEKDRDEWAGEIVFCSECDDEWWLDCDSPEDAGYHYCPNCGGKIEVEK